MEIVTLAGVRSALAELVARIDRDGQDRPEADVTQLRRALREVREYDSTTPVTRSHLDELDRSLGRILLGSTLPAGTAEVAGGDGGDGEPTQISALRAAVTLVSLGSPAQVSVDVDPHAHVACRVDGDDAAMLVAMTTYAMILTNHRDFVAAHNEHTGRFYQIYLTGDYPGTRAVRLSACLDAQPSADDLAALLELCGAETPVWVSP